MLKKTTTAAAAAATVKQTRLFQAKKTRNEKNNA